MQSFTYKNSNGSYSLTRYSSMTIQTLNARGQKDGVSGPLREDYIELFLLLLISYLEMN